MVSWGRVIWSTFVCLLAKDRVLVAPTPPTGLWMHVMAKDLAAEDGQGIALLRCGRAEVSLCWRTNTYPGETHRVFAFDQAEMMVDALFVCRIASTPSFAKVVSVESPVCEEGELRQCERGWLNEGASVVLTLCVGHLNELDIASSRFDDGFKVDVCVPSLDENELELVGLPGDAVEEPGEVVESFGASPDDDEGDERGRGCWSM